MTSFSVTIDSHTNFYAIPTAPHCGEACAIGRSAVRPKERPMKLQSKILLPILMVFTLALGLSGFLAYREAAVGMRELLVEAMRGDAEALVRSLRNLAKTATEDIALAADTEGVTRFFAGDTKAAAAVAEATKALKEVERLYPIFNRVTILDTNGRVLTTSRPELSKPGDNFSDRAYFKEAIKGKAFLASPFYSRVVKGALMAAAAPRDRGGKRLGVLYATMDMTPFFQNAVAPLTIGKEGFA
jgi:methyl-accepting chemotaxis protein